ncbi:MAG TPA: ABC transporter permease [Verrucomicrobiae bacterium]|nr:ABC transporter permease [Verrucomicrobiae bacterium]
MNFFTELSEGLAISWSAIRANKLRSVLTTLGIVIGIVTVTLMGTAITGLNRAFLRSISFLGADVLYVSRIDWFVDSQEEWLKMNKRPQITRAEIDSLQEKYTLARAIAPMIYSESTIQYKKRSANRVQIIGTTDQFQFTSSTAVTDGRFFSELESDNGRAVCVIGSDVATNLFPNESPLGEKILIGRKPFEVVGVLEKQGTFLGQSLDNQAMIPLSQMLVSIPGYSEYGIRVKVDNMADMDNARDELHATMRIVRRLAPTDDDNFSINEQDQILTIFHRVAGTIAIIGLFITGLSLFVGGVGIMNIMFVSVAERTREIGVRKAIGAKQRTILLQFLIEAATICLIGGMIGLGLAWATTFLIQKIMPVEMSLPIVIVSIVVSLLTGLISGFLPAWRAARMNTVDALRNE